MIRTIEFPLFGSEGKISLIIEKVLYEGKSDYQDILIAETRNPNSNAREKYLFLDGEVQCGFHDHFVYDGMLLSPLSSSNDKNIVICGGGDGKIGRAHV